MKIALLNDQLNAGGAEKVLINMANLMYAKGMQVIVVLFMGEAALDKQLHPSIQVFYLKRQSRWDFKAMLRLKAHVQNCDIVHVHSRYNLRFFMVAKYVTGIFSPKVVFHEHVPEFTQIDFFTSFLFKKIDGYVAVLKSICNWAVQNSKVEKNKVFYLPNIVAEPNFSPCTPTNAGTKAIMVGNFRRVKNHLFAIQLFEKLGNDFSLDLYGMTEDETYLQMLKSYISDNGLEERIRIVHGLNNLYEVLPHYNFAVHTASLETGPLVLLEYMHAGVPFLTLNTGDVANNIAHLLPELILPAFDLEVWKKSVYEIMMDETKRAVIREKMTELIAEYYTEEKYWQRLNNVYSTVLAKKGRYKQQPVTL